MGATVLVEVTMFLGTSFLAGTMGDTVLAAHMIGFSVANISFVLPFAISQAANVRVASALGAGRPDEAGRAGFAAMGLTAGIMAVIALALVAGARSLGGLYVAAGTAEGATTVAIAASLLRIAAMFQVADGVQTVAAGALRGMHDTRVPMLVATFGYWAVGASSRVAARRQGRRRGAGAMVGPVPRPGCRRRLSDHAFRQAVPACAYGLTARATSLPAHERQRERRIIGEV